MTASSETTEGGLGTRVRRWAACVLAVLAGVLVVWSFGWVATRPLRQGADLGGKTEITILHWGDRGEDEIVESLVKKCEARHPEIKIKRINAGAGYNAKLQTMIAGGNPPDLFHVPRRVGHPVETAALERHVGQDAVDAVFHLGREARHHRIDNNHRRHTQHHANDRRQGNVPRAEVTPAEEQFVHGGEKWLVDSE